MAFGIWMGIVPLECFKPIFNFQRHKLAALFEKIVVIENHAINERLRQATHLKVCTEFRVLRDAAIFFRSTSALLAKSAK